MKTTKNTKTINTPMPIKLLYFILIIIPYAAVLFLILSHTSYSLLIKFLIVGLFAFGWNGTGVKLFKKIYMTPYNDSLKDNSFLLFQYIAALALVHIIFFSLTGNV